MDLPSAMKWCKDNNVPFNDVTPIDESAEAESVDLTVKVDSPVRLRTKTEGE